MKGKTKKMPDFFEKITESLDKVLKTFSSKSREFLAGTKLKGEIKDIESSIQSRFNALGKKVFEMVNRGGLNAVELEADCKELASLYKKMAEVEEKIKKVELEAVKMRYGGDAIICPKCGAPNKYSDRFCISCGYALSHGVSAEGKTCSTCGAPIKERAKFCMRCGSKIV